MSSRRFSLSKVWLPTLGLALLLAASIVLVASENRVLLGTEVLAQSRGSNQKLVYDHAPCTDLDGDAPCSVVNSACTTCGFVNYLYLRMGALGGYTGNGTFSSCGNRLSGFCDASLNCTKDLKVTGTCTPPPKVVVQ